MSGRYGRGRLLLLAALPLVLTVVMVVVLAAEDAGFSGFLLLVLVALWGPVVFLLVAPPVIRVENERLFVRNGFGRAIRCPWADVSGIEIRLRAVRTAPDPVGWLIVSYRGRGFTTDVELSCFPGTAQEIAAELGPELPSSIPFTAPEP
ncbi:hypothetical protein [Actinocorallia longicatena]|uniref:PH (Pleckstrin Homology) domain-containing protein n=1 Tax=Actinocorallia longicatena TaxID=111803 RepID=A0ABP6QGU4_9ACTN